ncbi:MAG TPA: helix-turn-helix transcriptional regulator, partial [Caldilineaceae bacterium]|nr:helix-turn-helix transcriptional regulator [Caldilineaceae bacterium]
MKAMIGVMLSDSEQEILLALIACTNGNEALAQRLNISVVSVKRYLNQLYRKTSTSNKIALIRWALCEAYKAIKINSRTYSQVGMNLFQVQVHRPFSDDLVTVTEAMLIVATGIGKGAEPEAGAPAFGISVTEDTVTAQVRRHDGREVYARLFFDGQRFILAAAG